MTFPPYVAPTRTPQQAEYEIRVYNHNGNLIAVIDPRGQLRNFVLDLKLNDIDTLTMQIAGTETNLIALFTTDTIIQVFRKPDFPGAQMSLIYTGFHRTPQKELTEANNEIFTSYSRGLTDLLHRRKILYAANTFYTGKSGYGSWCIGDYVTENATAAAVSPPRKRDGTIANFSMGPYTVPDVYTAYGVQWSGFRSWQNLLDVCQEIAAATLWDFKVVPVAGLNLPGVLAFQCQVSFAGYDATHPIPANIVTFATDFGNMATPRYVMSRTEEQNIVAVLGPGQESNRRVVIRSDSVATAVSPWNYIEATYDVSSGESLATLNDAGDAQLKLLQAQPTFDFQPIQIMSCQFQQHYNVGDKIKAYWGNITEYKRITAVQIDLNQGKEKIALTFGVWSNTLVPPDTQVRLLRI